jgi:meso-butanediol dehydrogenase / (S,S)-butanediol dehydrogenase / diacetyl reductase
VSDGPATSRGDTGRLEGRLVLVTGGSRGLGLESARALAERGARLVLVARAAAALADATASLPGSGHRWLAFDVSDEDAWRRHLEDVDELAGLVTAAAVLKPVGVIGSYSLAAFRRTLETNLLGTLLAIHCCLPALRAGRGSIVTFGGGGATSPLPRFDAYASSKAAVARLTENLAAALGPDGITVNCVAPGFVTTGIHEATLAAGPAVAGTEYYERTRREISRGGFPASEAAELVCLLLEGVPFTGKLVSAQWDPWRDHQFHERLATEPALATVRRIDGTAFIAVGSGGEK